MSTKRRGYTKDGYPIVWLKKCSKEECLEHLKNGTKPVSKPAAKDCSKEKINKPIETEETKFKIGKRSITISADKRQYILMVDSFTTYWQSYGSMLKALREQLIKLNIKNEKFSNLNDLIESEKKITAELFNWLQNK